MEIKMHFASPLVILKHPMRNHEGMYDLKNPRAKKRGKHKNDQSSPRELKTFFKITLAVVLCVRGLTNKKQLKNRCLNSLKKFKKWQISKWKSVRNLTDKSDVLVWEIK